MKSPFKFLDSYTKEDREIFFGREKEVDELYRRLFDSRILLVYGESGTGKSSLINCGLINKLSDSGFKTINIRRSDNILESLSGAIQNLLAESMPRQMLTALSFKKALREISDDTRKQLIFIFDQFEELFIFGTKEEKQSLIQVLKALVESDIGCRFVFIIREEYFSDIAEFEKQLPNFLSNRMRIEKMSRSNAVEIINGSCSVNDIVVENGFAENLIKRLNPDNPGIELAYLQVYLDKIFNKAVGGSNNTSDQKSILFTSELIDKTGNVSDLLGNYLEEQISLMPNPDTALAILKSFVSYKGTKRMLNITDVKDYANTLGENVREKTVLEIIRKLVQLRILCDVNENGYYELRHDSLAFRIFEKISAAEIEILEVHQFIESAYYFWKKHFVLLSEDDIKYISPFEKKLSLSEDLTGFIDMSRQKLIKSRTSKRKIIVSAGIIIICLLSIFSVWALTERDRADGLKTKALAEKFNLLATNIAVHNPTKGLRLAEYAFSLDTTNRSIMSNVKKIYSDNSFYTLIAQQEDAIAKQEDAINSVTFSPDGKTILTGSGDATAKLWDLKGTLIKTFVGHAGFVNSVAFSPDGQSILTSSTDRSARLWDINGNIIRDFNGHSRSVNSVAFSADGKKILTGSSDGTARIWNLDGIVLQEFKGHVGSVSSAVFSSDGRHILTGSFDSTAIIWDMNGKPLKILKGHLDHINSVAFSPDGKYILTGSSDKTAKLWDLQGKLIRVFNGFPGEVNAVAFSPDGKKILAGASAGFVILCDLNGNEIKEFKGHYIQVKAVAFSPDGTKIVTGSGDCTAKLWDLTENLNDVFVGHSGRINSVKFSRDGQFFLSGSSDKSARIWDLEGNSIHIFKGNNLGINDAAWSPDGQKILTGSDDGTARLWDQKGNLVTIYSGHKSGVKSVAFSPDGKKVLTGSEDATAMLWSIDGKVLMIFKGHNSSVNAVAFSPDGNKILTGSNDYSACLWNMNGKILVAMKGQSSAINSVTFSPDGSTLLTGAYGSDPSARLWDLKGNLIKVFKGHTTSIFSVVFSPDGKKILTGSADQTAILWDINGNIDQVFSGYNSYVRTVAFSPDGQHVLLGLDNGSIRLYPVKKSYKEFRNINNYENLTGFDKLLYNITDINSLRYSADEKELLEASEYNINEAIQSSTTEKGKYLENALEFYRKLKEQNPDKKEYLFKLLRSSVYDYETIPTEHRKKEIDEINAEILNLSSVDELKLACYAYCLTCVKNDSCVIALGIPECFFQISRKLMTYDDPSKTGKKDISRWCTFLASDLIQKKDYPDALRAVELAQVSDSTNDQVPVLLPFVYIFNNQYNKAENIFNKFKHKQITGIENFKTFGEIYSHYITLMEDRAITSPDFVRAKKLLKE